LDRPEKPISTPYGLQTAGTSVSCWSLPGHRVALAILPAATPIPAQPVTAPEIGAAPFQISKPMA
jgi:hypothetical protein